jgi:hypothetical protein
MTTSQGNHREFLVAHKEFECDLEVLRIDRQRYSPLSLRITAQKNVQPVSRVK